MSEANIEQYFISEDEAVFKGHFPDNPVFPGVLLMGLTHQFAKQSISDSVELVKVNRHRFSGMVTPGDEMHIKLTIKPAGDMEYLVSSIVSVEDNVVAKGKFTFAHTDKHALTELAS